MGHDESPIIKEIVFKEEIDHLSLVGRNHIFHPNQEEGEDT